MPRSKQSEFNGTKPARRTHSRQMLAAIALPAALLLMPLLALKLYIVKYPLRWINEDAVARFWTKDFVSKEHSEHYKIITIGDSSTNAGFVPELLGENFINLAVRSNSPSSAYYVLKRYLSNNESPETVYLAFYGDYHFQNANGFSSWVLLQYFTRKEEAEFISKVRELKDDTKEFDFYADYKLISLNKYWPYLKNSGINGRINKNKSLLKKQSEHRGSEVTRCTDVWKPSPQTTYDAVFGQTENHSGNHNWRHFTVSPLQDFYYKKILDLCKERGIFIRIQVLPIPLENYGPGYWDEFRAYHEEALAGYDSWTLDTSQELASATTGGYSIGDFADDHHFNNHGSLKFCRMIRERYPEDFAEGAAMPVSDNTLAGLEDYLRMENQADKILRWIQGTGRSEGGVPLSALLVTRNGHTLEEDWNLARVLREEYPAYAEGLVAWGSGDAACYFSGEASASISGEAPAALSCDGGAASLSFSDGAVSLSAFDDGRNFRARLHTTENGQPRTQELSVPDGADLYAIVLNTRTGRLVTSKSFRFTGWSYKLL